MSDPISCPECEGTRGQRLGKWFMACQFCGGLGWVGGDHEPAEDSPEPPDGPPPAWEHPIWRAPEVASGIACRYCLGARQVTHMDETARTMVAAPCPACAPVT